MGRYRVDFSVRELDMPVSSEDARGVRFGHDIDVEGIFDFFNQCRNAVMTLFGQRLPADPLAEERKRFEAKIERLEVELREAKLELHRRQANRPVLPDRYQWPSPSDRRRWMDDGSRGADGTLDPERLRMISHQVDDESRGGDGPSNAE